MQNNYQQKTNQLDEKRTYEIGSSLTNLVESYETILQELSLFLNGSNDIRQLKRVKDSIKSITTMNNLDLLVSKFPLPAFISCLQTFYSLSQSSPENIEVFTILIDIFSKIVQSTSFPYLMLIKIPDFIPFLLSLLSFPEKTIQISTLRIINSLLGNQNEIANSLTNAGIFEIMIDNYSKLINPTLLSVISKLFTYSSPLSSNCISFIQQKFTYYLRKNGELSLVALRHLKFIFSHLSDDDNWATRYGIINISEEFQEPSEIIMQKYLSKFPFLSDLPKLLQTFLSNQADESAFIALIDLFAFLPIQIQFTFSSDDPESLLIFHVLDMYNSPKLKISIFQYWNLRGRYFGGICTDLIIDLAVQSLESDVFIVKESAISVLINENFEEFDNRFAFGIKSILESEIQLKECLCKIISLLQSENSEEWKNAFEDSLDLIMNLNENNTDPEIMELIQLFLSYYKIE